jgi:rhodanese-related sulfurtransferase
MRSYIIAIFFLFILAGISAGQTTDSLKFKSLPPTEFQAQLEKSVNGMLVDVREFFEYKKIRIRNAVNIPSSGNIQHACDTIDKNRPLFFYCTSGFRSKRVAKAFSERGFTCLYSLDGGLTAWKKDKLQVDRKKIRRK